MSFPPDFINRVREASDLLEVISQYVSLKKRGGNWFGLCPFHSETKPSFSVNPAKGIYYCFSCHTGGNVVSFIMQREKMTFPEAVEFLARRARMEIPRETSREKSGREKMFNALLKGHKYFREQYTRSPIPKQYLASRSFGKGVADKMELGYAPDGWSGFADTLSGGQKLMISVGLLRERESGGYYDYFRNRLIFPIKDLAGRVCAFGGRYLGDDPESAKYLNSPESQVFSKGSLLYALCENRDSIRKSGFAYIVEGYTDLLRLISAGMDNSAAGLGTSFTDGQAKLLRRYTEKAVLIYDGDRAGRAAAVKTGRVISSAGMEVEIIPLPEGHDPDSFVLKFGKEGLEKTKGLSIFEFQLKASEEDLNSRSGREKAARELLESAAVLPGEMKRSLALEEISDLLNLPVLALRSELRRLRRNLSSPEENIESKKIEVAAVEYPQLDLVRLLISRPDCGESVFPMLDQESITNPILNKVYSAMKSLWLKGELKEAHSLLGAFDSDEIRSFIAESAIWEPPCESRRLAEDCVKKLSTAARRKEASRIREQIKAAESKGEDVSGLLKELQNLKKGGDT